MAKRTNPFVEDFIPQSKIHVGMKQFNNNEHRLKKVYEKTLELLFRGAKKSVVQNLNNFDVSSTKKDKMKQLFIGKDGTLLHSGSMVTDRLALRQCKCTGVAETKCAYCEDALCGPCQHTCERCEQSYCQQCLLLGSEGSEVCVSCYG